jgi:hypothetical protein
MIHNYTPAEHTDGSYVFMQPADRARKLAAGGYLQYAWAMALQPLPPLSFVDFLGSRQGRPCCWVSLISRSYTWPQLMGWGGIFLKYRTYVTLQQLAQVPLSIAWLGAYVVYDLADGLYAQHVGNIPPVRVIAYDPRGAVNDTEPAVLVTHLERVA